MTKVERTIHNRKEIEIILIQHNRLSFLERKEHSSLQGHYNKKDAHT